MINKINERKMFLKLFFFVYLCIKLKGNLNLEEEKNRKGEEVVLLTIVSSDECITIFIFQLTINVFLCLF